MNHIIKSMFYFTITRLTLIISTYTFHTSHPLIISSGATYRILISTRLQDNSNNVSFPSKLIYLSESWRIRRITYNTRRTNLRILWKNSGNVLSDRREYRSESLLIGFPVILTDMNVKNSDKNGRTDDSL